MRVAKGRHQRCNRLTTMSERQQATFLLELSAPRVWASRSLTERSIDSSSANIGTRTHLHSQRPTLLKLSAPVQTRLHTLLILGVSGLLLPWLNSLFADMTGWIAWMIDLASHWQWLFLAMTITAALLLSLAKPWWLLILLILPLPWLSASDRLASAPGTAQTLVVASANVYVGNRDVRPLQTWLNKEKPDVVICRCWHASPWQQRKRHPKNLRREKQKARRLSPSGF